MWMSFFSNTSSLMPSRAARLRTTVRAASTDSFITSPSEPVRVITPLPGISGRFDRQQIAADLGPGQTNHLPDLVVVLGSAIGVLAHAQESRSGCPA
jgi:hypothetical protein